LPAAHLSVEVVADIDGLALLMQAVRSGLGATLQPGAAISHLDHQALRVIGVAIRYSVAPTFWSACRMMNSPRQALRLG
jgi:LysR family tcuABC transcriptional regulator